MTTARRAVPAALWTLQWTLAVAFFLLGLLKVGLPLDDLQQRLHLLAGAGPGQLAPVGWLEVAGGLLLVLPAATRFWPRLTPAAAAYLAVTVLLGVAGDVAGASPGSGLGLLLPDLALGLACAAVAAGRGFVDPVAPLDLRPEPRPAPRPSGPARPGRHAPRPHPGPTTPRPVAGGRAWPGPLPRWAPGR